MSAALVEKACVNAPHYRDVALAFNTVRTLDSLPALLHFGGGYFVGQTCLTAVCTLSVISVTRSDRGVGSGGKRRRLKRGA